MMSFLLALVFSLVPIVQVASDAPVDFSGTWRMDPKRSATAVQVEPVGPITLIVTQAPDRITVQTTTSRRTASVEYRFDADSDSATPDRAIAQWGDGALQLDAVQTVSGQSVTMSQTWRLGQGGRELEVDSVLNVQHGYSAVGAQVAGTGRDVYVRVGGG